MLALCPDVLSVDACSPILLEGGSTATGPDQLYLTKDGRCVVVEIKNEKAKAEGLVRLLAYGEHWRTLPVGELQISVREIVAAVGANRSATEALTRLRQVAAMTLHQVLILGSHDHLARLARATLGEPPQVNLDTAACHPAGVRRVRQARD